MRHHLILGLKYKENTKVPVLELTTLNERNVMSNTDTMVKFAECLAGYNHNIMRDGTYRYGTHKDYFVAIREPKSDEIDQRKEYFIRKKDEFYSPIDVKSLCKLLEAC